jgi:hypothetical protein
MTESTGHDGLPLADMLQSTPRSESQPTEIIQINFGSGSKEEA